MHGLDAVRQDCIDVERASDSVGQVAWQQVAHNLCAILKNILALT
jgi:hypothetical protein